MQRLFALIKKITIFSPEEEAGLRSWLRKKELLPRERLGEDIPSGSWIFVEEGFLLLLQREKKEWVCKNFYYEGVSTTVYNVGSAELEEKSFNVQAVEKSTIYYLTPEDEADMQVYFTPFFYARMILNMRSYCQHKKRASLFTLESELDRILYVKKYFAILFRAPEKHLADFLCVKKKIGRMLLASMQKKARSPQN